MNNCLSKLVRHTPSATRCRHTFRILHEETDFLEPSTNLSGSEDEGENGDEQRHNRLLDAITSLDGKKRIHEVQRSEPSNQVSEFGITTEAGKVKLDQLVGALSGTTSHGALKKQLNRIQNKNKILDVPLPKVEQERIRRSLAYEQTVQEVTKWDPIVEKNRKAEQLQFPLQRVEVKLQTTDQIVKRFEPRTPLELEIAALLQGNKNTVTKTTELTEAEQRALKAMDLAEAKERRAELQKYRALLSYKESKAKRQKKIKSKKFHRVMRKEKQKADKKAMDELEKNDPEAYLEQLKKLEKNRVQERMNLKHRGGSKFMNKQAAYAKYDDKARQSVQEMIQKNQELTQKMAVSDESDDEDDDVVTEVVMETEINHPAADAPSLKANPWMSAAPEKRKPIYQKPQAVINKEDKEKTEEGDSSDEEDSESLPEESEVNIDELFNELKKKKEERLSKSKISEASKQKIRMLNSKKNSKKRKHKQEVEESEGEEEDENEEDSSDEEDEQLQKKSENSNTKKERREESLISESVKRKRTLDDMEEDWSDVEELLDKEGTGEAEIGDKEKEEGSGLSKDKNEKVDPKKVLRVEHKIRASQKPLMIEDEEEAAEAEHEHHLTIAEAFASDDVVEEFKAEKKATEQRDRPKNIDLTLPGWGDWGGESVKPSKKKRRKFMIKAPPAPPRKDNSLGNVIISETKDTTIAKHQVSQLPFPFSNVHQFESSIRAPVGKTWNTETAFKDLIKPKITKRLGTVIEPISKSETFKNEKQNKHIEEKVVKKRKRRGKKSKK